MLVTFLPVTQAYAYNFGYNGYQVAPGQPIPICTAGKGLVARIVPCIKETIIDAVNHFLMPFSMFFAKAIAALCTLAIAIGGYWVASGRTNAALRDMTILFIKIIFVGMFAFNFGGMFGTFLDVMEEMSAIAAHYATYTTSLTYNMNCQTFWTSNVNMWLWENLDCALELLVGGIASPATLFGGMAGFLVGAFLSTTAGMFVALLCFYIITQSIFAIARAVYIFLCACIGFAIMVLFSPIFVPCIVLQATKPYFDKWMRLTISFLIQPVIVFAYISMMTAALDKTVFVGEFSVFRTIAGNDVDQPNFQIGKWLIDKGMYANDFVGGQAIGVNPRRILETLKAPVDLKSGTAGNIGDTIVGTAADWRQNIYKKMGIEKGNLNFFKVGWPTKPVNWTKLSYERNLWTFEFVPGPGGIPVPFYDPTPFMVKLFVSCFMAAVVAYIFMVMLDSLPFLTAGIAGAGGGGMPILGHGQLAPPGSNLMESFKAKMQGLAGSGRIGR